VGRRFRVRVSRAAALLAAGLPAMLSGAVAAPAGEIVREEAYNYRIVGKLPEGWARRDDELVWTFLVDGIPHAHVHLVRHRLDGDVDAADELERRAKHYRFPGMADARKGEHGRAAWGGEVVPTYSLSTTHKGVACRRVVRARCAGSIWYEQIETTFGDVAENDPGCAEGLAVFRRGFRLLAPPVPREALSGTDAATIEDAAGGFRLEKPGGFRRLAVDPGREPGLRVALRAEAADPRVFALVRLFEYGRYPRFSAEPWLNSLYTGFATEHEEPKREPAPRPAIEGADEVHAAVFTGRRETTPRRVRVILCRTPEGRVFVLRITTSKAAAAEFGTKLHALVESLRLSG